MATPDLLRQCHWSVVGCGVAHLSVPLGRVIGVERLSGIYLRASVGPNGARRSERRSVGAGQFDYEDYRSVRAETDGFSTLTSKGEVRWNR